MQEQTTPSIPLKDGGAPQNGHVRGSGKAARVTVESSDDLFIYAVTDTGEHIKVCYVDGLGEHARDWTYLRDMLHPYDRLNIIRPQCVEGVVYPELIIYEPDCLVNITTIARCFTYYASSPLIDLISKFLPMPQSESILLGRFAGQLFDEALRSLPPSHTYNDSVKTFFKRNALAMLSVDINNERFHENAKAQQKNITAALDDLAADEPAFDRDAGMVEPSFVCNTLGLQGRMDYLQRDMSLIIEQKAGNGEFPFDGYHTPNKKEEHYVQMLLYTLIIRYNYEDAYEANGRQLRSLLLYSKYDHPLCPCDFNPQTAFDAIRVRNGIAWLSVSCAQPGGFNMLMDITPEKLNEKNISGKLWERFLRPKIAYTLDTIHNASPLERAYFFRFLEFVAAEQRLAITGTRERPCSGTAAAWRASLEEKLDAGTILCNMRLTEPILDDEGELKEIVLASSPPDTPAGTARTEHYTTSDFRRGDTVAFYSYPKGGTPNITATIIFHAVIKEMAAGTVTLTLKAPQHSTKLFAGRSGHLWAVEHVQSSADNTLYHSLHAFLSAPKERRSLLLLQRRPNVDTTLTLRGDYGCFNDMALHARQARELFLIIGPPGTGKTSYGMLYTLQEELHDDNASALLLAYTNRAVDEICAKLEGAHIDYVRIGTQEGCAPAYHDRLLSVLAGKAQTLKQLKDAVTQCRVIVSTVISLNINSHIFDIRSFSLCIVDEASQILEPYLVGLLSACQPRKSTAGRPDNKGNPKPTVGRLVLIGDYKQLPAVVMQDKQTSRVDDPRLQDILLTNCRDSLFERLCRKYRNDTAVTCTLTRQGRMHSDIALFPGTEFYDGSLQPAEPQWQESALPRYPSCNDTLDQLLCTHRVAFISVPPPPPGGNDKVNSAESDIIAAILLRIYMMHDVETFKPDTSAGVIVPYRNQTADVRRAIDDLCRQTTSMTLHDSTSLQAITIDTVERFQGSERDSIIYGFTVRYPEQLAFLTDNTYRDEMSGKLIDRKLNVALTRARQRLIVVGNAPLLAREPVFCRLIDFARRHGGFLDLSVQRPYNAPENLDR